MGKLEDKFAVITGATSALFLALDVQRSSPGSSCSSTAALHRFEPIGPSTQRKSTP